ncbi:MAG TPA: glycosyltransferase family 2 protein [Rhizomicrobium sp.]|jgi:cellulose synthase/poly-beta-1,6-N-acetylglucosamine synthase-like glycosyltransferase|nr:glycosyltransferase family 2 protein [Rhizomicrobium sp.]
MTAYAVLVKIVDAIAVAALLGVILVGVGFLLLPVLYLIEWAGGKLRSAPSSAIDGSDETLPGVLVQLPIYNEPPSVIGGLLQSVAALDWPRAKLRVQILDDSDFANRALTERAVAVLREGGFRAEHLVRNERHGYKAGALAAGLAASDEPYVAILDADFRPTADWLKSTVPALAAHPGAGFVQSRCEFSNSGTNWLTRAQSLLFDSHFLMEQGVRARAGMLFQFNGTGGVWRRKAIEDAGGWTADSLCEDLDLTIRAALAGWRGLFLMNPPVAGLVPDQVRHWRVQQRRWASGFAQIARKLSARLWRSGWSVNRKLQAGFLILYQGALPVIALATAALLVDIVLRGGGMPPVGPIFATIFVLFFPVVVGMTLPPYLELRRGSLVQYVLTVCSLPPLILYLSVANARPIVAAFLGRGEAFKRTPKSLGDT